VLEGGKEIGKEIAKRGPIDLGDILASKPEADDECEMMSVRCLNEERLCSIYKRVSSEFRGHLNKLA